MHFSNLLRMLAGNVGSLFDVIAQIIENKGGYRKRIIKQFGCGFRPFNRQLQRPLSYRESAIALIVNDRLVKGFGTSLPR